MKEKGRVYSKKYRRIHSEITKLLASTEPSTADIAVSDISDFHLRNITLRSLIWLWFELVGNPNILTIFICIFQLLYL